MAILRLSLLRHLVPLGACQRPLLLYRWTSAQMLLRGASQGHIGCRYVTNQLISCGFAPDCVLNNLIPTDRNLLHAGHQPAIEHVLR